MKRFVLAAAAIILLGVCVCCAKEEADISASAVVIHGEWAEAEYTIRTKEITGQAAREISTLFAGLEETGETESKISDLSIEEYDAQELMNFVWLETDGKLYRFERTSDGGGRLCRVGSHLGEGSVLRYDESCEEALWNLLYCWPYDCWHGTYRDGEYVLKHQYAAETDITFEIREFDVTRMQGGQGERGTLVLEATSEKKQDAAFSITAQHSGDNIFSQEFLEVPLKARRKQIVELPFYGEDTTYFLYVRAGNTRMEIIMNSPYMLEA